MSLLFGTFGIPLGPIFVVDTILRNVSGGDQPSRINGQLLRNIATYASHKAGALLAAQTLAASLHFEYNESAKDALNELLSNYPELSKAARKEKARQWAISPFLAVLSGTAALGAALAAL